MRAKDITDCIQRSRLSRVGLSLLLGERAGRQRDKAIAAFVQLEPAVKTAGADDFAGMRDVGEILADLAGGAADGRVARADDANTLEQAHCAVHLEAEVGNVGRGDFFEDASTQRPST